MSASDVIARLRELSEQHWAASGPFKMPPNTPVEELSLFGLNRNFLAAAAVTLPALLECAEALERLLPEAINDRYVTQSGAVEKARAALDALAAQEKK